MLARTIDGGVSALERQLQALQAYHFDTLSLQDIRVTGLPARTGQVSQLTLQRADLHRALDGTLRLVSNVEVGDVPLLLSGTAEFDPATSRLTRLEGHTGRIDLGAIVPPADEADEDDERPFGSDSELSLDLSLDRATPDDPAFLRATARVGAGHLQLGLNRTRLESGSSIFPIRRGRATGDRAKPVPVSGRRLRAYGRRGTDETGPMPVRRRSTVSSFRRRTSARW